jgi:hypothetical protein
MRRTILLVLLFLLLSACGKGEVKVVRIDIQKVTEDGNTQEELIITDDKTLAEFITTFDKIKWDRSDVTMAREPDYLVSFFYHTEEGIPELIYENRIWFNEGGTATVISTDPSKVYGGLVTEQAGKLKELIESEFTS